MEQSNFMSAMRFREPLVTKTKVVNLFGGPGAGKSTIASGLFYKLKMANIDCEYVTEYAKELTWWGAGPRVFAAQDMIHGMQHFRMLTVADSGVPLIITDSPLLLGLVYMPGDYPQQSLKPQIREAVARYENLNIFLRRTKPYNPKGRYQDESQARNVDVQIGWMLEREQIPFELLEFNSGTVDTIFSLMVEKNILQ